MLLSSRLTCNKYPFFFGVISRHCRRSPSCPNDPLTVGMPSAELIDFTVSEARPDRVVSRMTCGGLLLINRRWYREQTEGKNNKRVSL